MRVSTAALAGNDATYNRLENQLQSVTAYRDALAAKMLERLTAAEFQGKRIADEEAKELVFEANILLYFVNSLAGGESK